jgi:hypothetical protein
MLSLPFRIWQGLVPWLGQEALMYAISSSGLGELLTAACEPIQ